MMERQRGEVPQEERDHEIPTTVAGNWDVDGDPERSYELNGWDEV